MPYFCETCNYETDKKTNYDKHMETLKHKEKLVDAENKSYPCEYCDLSYAHRQSLFNHKKKCRNRPQTSEISELKQKLQEKEQENAQIMKQLLAEKDKQLQEKNKQIEEIKQEKQEIKQEKNKEIEYHKSLTKQAGQLVGAIAVKSVNALTYAMTNFNDAPCLMPLKDYSVIREDTEEESFEEKIVYKYKTNQIVKYLSQIIVGLYIKNNPDQQATWNTDVSRHHYIVHDKDGDDIVWMKDKKGLRCKKKIVVPMLLYIRKLMENYLSTLNKTAADKVTNYETIGNIALIIGKIDKGSIANEMIKEMAPYFVLDKNLQLIKQ